MLVYGSEQGPECSGGGCSLAVFHFDDERQAGLPLMGD